MIKNCVILHDVSDEFYKVAADRFNDVEEDETYKNQGLGSLVHVFQDRSAFLLPFVQVFYHHSCTSIRMT